MATATKSNSRPKRPPVRKKSRPNPIREFRRRYALSQALLARLLDVSLRTASAAESATTIPSPLRRSLTQVNRLCDALGETMQPGFVGQWLDQPNEMLDALKPIEAIERGQIDLVWQVVEGLRSGSQL